MLECDTGIRARELIYEKKWMETSLALIEDSEPTSQGDTSSVNLLNEIL